MSVKAALSTVADALTAHGFAAHAEARGATPSAVAPANAGSDTRVVPARIPIERMVAIG